MKFAVEITRRAEEDLDAIVAWMAERSPRGAAAWLDSLEDVIGSLRTTAASCALAPENGHGGTEIRQTVFSTRSGRPYRLLLTIVDQTVFVRHIRGPGQDLVSPEELGDSTP